MSSGYRADKSGFAAEAQQKTNAKYDPSRAKVCLEWISQRIGESFDTSGDMDNFQKQLKDGFKLAKLINSIGGNLPSKKTTKAETMAFKQMETIGLILDELKKFGLESSELFQTVDLYEAQNLNAVVVALECLARKKGSFGPKEATQNKRNFTDEQLRAGQGVIGLQMGTNKGANQSGMNMGNTRHIVD